MTYDIKSFAQLNIHELYALLALRNRVFVVEQGCAYHDIDGDKDFAALHLMYWQDGVLAAYARILPPQAGQSAAIGRVLVDTPYRGSGLARILMQQAMDECTRRWPGRIYVQAQQYLHDFYRSLGFTVASAVYDEDGIPHVDMYCEAA